MRDLRKYWQEVNSMAEGLSEFEFVAAQAGGSLVEVSRSVAAKMLHAKTHRLATEEEIDAYRAGEDDARRQAFHDELRRKGIAVVPVSEAGKKRA